MKGYFENFFECHFQLINLHLVLCNEEEDVRVRVVNWKV